MKPQEKFPLLRSILRTLGLSTGAVDSIVERVDDFLSERGGKQTNKLEYPYHLRDDFLSRAELSFFLVLKKAVSHKALICTKVDLGDLFYVKSNNRSKYRSYTNKIDRKHVDYLLCDPKTVKPLLGIELDDKSHQKSERQARDKFVEKVFMAAKLPLVRIPVQRSYSILELESLLQQYIGLDQVETPNQSVITEKQSLTPLCPKCGTEMVLKTAKTGSNQGGQFWGCPDYPRCRGILKYESLVVS
jgi:hypothetical protein